MICLEASLTTVFTALDAIFSISDFPAAPCVLPLFVVLVVSMVSMVLPRTSDILNPPSCCC